MANAFPTVLVPGPARVPVLFGLFSVLDFREDPERRWEGGGVTWESYDINDVVASVGRVQAPQSETTGITKTFERSADEDSGGVFTVYATQKITPGAWSLEDTDERAKTLLLLGEERAVETILSTNGVLSPSFADAPAALGSFDVDTFEGMAGAIGHLETFLASVYGSRGIIHMTRGNALTALGHNLLDVRGAGLYTKLGTPVVAGSGYAAGAMYATSPFVAYRSEIFPDVRPGELLDKGNNDNYAIAERTYSLGFEEAGLATVTITEDNPA